MIYVSNNKHKINTSETKSIVLYSNDSTNSRVKLTVKVAFQNIDLPIRPMPRIADFDTIKAGERHQLTLTLANTGSEETPLALVDRPKDKRVKISIKDMSVKPHETTEIKISLDGISEPGRFYTSFTLDVKGRKKSRITIPIRAVVIGNESSSSSDLK